MTGWQIVGETHEVKGEQVKGEKSKVKEEAKVKGEKVNESIRQWGNDFVKGIIHLLTHCLIDFSNDKAPDPMDRASFHFSLIDFSNDNAFHLSRLTFHL